MSDDRRPPRLRRLSVVVPVYRNELSLLPLLAALEGVEAQLASRALELELVFVDDGSPDDSLAVLREIKRRRPATLVVKLARNFGSMHASKTGMSYVTGDCFLVLAADLQDPPELIVEMADRWLSGAKFVICAREGREDDVRARAFSWLFYRLVRLIAVPGYPRGGFDVALMDRELLPHLLDSPRHVNPTLFAYALGYTPTTIPYIRRRREHGKSGWTLRKRLNYLVDSLIGASVMPLRAMSLLGTIVALGCFTYGSSVVLHALRGPREAPGFATLATLTSLLLGLVIVSLGIAGEYLWRIYASVSRQPDAIVDDLFPPQAGARR